jgi:ferredoxin
MCVLVARHTFALGPEGLSTVVDAAGDPSDVVLNAAEQCPMSAITVRDAETGVVLFGQ